MGPVTLLSKGDKEEVFGKGLSDTSLETQWFALAAYLGTGPFPPDLWFLERVGFGRG